MISDEEKLYHELIAKYQAVIDAGGTTTDSIIWKSVNEVLQQLINKGHSHYSRFIITPNQGHKNYINFVSFRLQLMSALQRMSQDFEFSDPTYKIYNYLPKTGTQVSATASPTQYNHQANQQSQTQTQEIELSIDQRVELIEEKLMQNLTEEQISEIKPALEEYKAEPTKWSKASKLIKAVLGLSKDVAVDVIAHIIAAQIGIPKI